MLQERIKQMEKEMDEVHALEYRIKLESAEAKNRVSYRGLSAVLCSRRLISQAPTV